MPTLKGRETAIHQVTKVHAVSADVSYHLGRRIMDEETIPELILIVIWEAALKENKFGNKSKPLARFSNCLRN